VQPTAPGAPGTAAPGTNGRWPVERLLRHDRTIVVASLGALIALAWVYLIQTAVTMPAQMGMTEMAMPGMAMPSVRAWTPFDLLVLFFMWAVMMIAMMLPSAAPTILLVLATHRRRGAHGSALVAGCFVGGYLAVWTMFSAGAATAQWSLQRVAFLSAEMTAISPIFGGFILMAAGIYQWLPIKFACLSHCRSPLTFLSTEWREGRVGALKMGLRHGLFCLGCCWALMALLFVAGVMNLVWVATIAVFVFVEKLASRGVLVGRVAGVLLLAWGCWLIFDPL